MFVSSFLHLLLMVTVTQSAPMLSWDFSGDALRGLPKGWQTRGRSSRPVYEVNADADGNRYISAQSRGSDVQLGVDLAGRGKQFSVLSWRWRARELPAGADERKVKTMDSAASVYAVFGSTIFPRILKYVWSTSVPVGTVFKHPSSGRMMIIIVNTGHPGQWQEVKRDLATDYKAAFGSNPPNLIAIGIKTDSDSTRTSAAADYDDIRLSRE
jgi:hypothetical protein